MRNAFFIKAALAAAVVAVAGAFFYQVPAVNDRLSWRVDAAATYLRGVLNPVEPLPTPLPPPAVSSVVIQQEEPEPTAAPDPTATLEGPTPTPPPTPTPIPGAVTLDTPAWEKQDWNNCGPATLAQYLRYFGWEGDQFEISSLLKPIRGDRNVNVEELIYYVRTRSGWLNAEFRVGGDIDQLKSFLAAGIPVMVEEGFDLDTEYWPNDDGWSGHYLLLTGYDDVTRTFTAQDSFTGPDQQVTYDDLDASWRIFNRVYILVYLPGQEEAVREILGPHLDEAYNRQHALEVAEAEAEANPEDAFAWFNVGTNLVYFERYNEAARAYDEARRIGLPQRMLRYQFGPFFAYFHSGRTEELLALTDYALQRTPNSEEALLWHGWGLFRQGDRPGAAADFRAALEANRFYLDAQYALDFINSN